MATSKSGGSTGNGRESISKRLGCKRFDGQVVNAGEVIVRQRGTRIHAGKGVLRGGDDTLFACIAGQVKFHSGLKGRRFVSVLQIAQ
jgi:large subunit ribosomal protein L27